MGCPIPMEGWPGWWICPITIVLEGEYDPADDTDDLLDWGWGGKLPCDWGATGGATGGPSER